MNYIPQESVPLNKYLQDDFSSIDLSAEQKIKTQELVDVLLTHPYAYINKMSEVGFEDNFYQDLIKLNLNPTLIQMALRDFLKYLKVTKIETRYKRRLSFHWITQIKPEKIIDKKNLQNLTLRRWW